MIFKPQNKILAILHHAAEVSLLLLDWLFFVLHRSSSPQRGSKILIVRLDAIGDFITWLASAKELRAFYGHHQITLLGNDLWTDLAKELPWFDEVRPLNRKRFLMNPLYRWKMLKQTYKSGFQIVLHPVLTRDFFVGDVSVRASGAPVRVGFTGNYENITPWQKKIGDT
jgi:ADP-heptose:LPS heptosyltransferase